MVNRELEKYNMTLCKWCDNLAPLPSCLCDYCSYEMDMMRHESYVREAMV